MRVTVSAHGKFHAFELGRQLSRLGVLNRIITSDPRIVMERGIPLHRAWALPMGEALARVPPALGLANAAAGNQMKARTHDRCAAVLLGSPDVVVAWSSAARYVLEGRARTHGALPILERGSTHIAQQDEVLRDEVRPLRAVRRRRARGCGGGADRVRPR